MQSCLGFASYYRNHIKNFARIARSLYKFFSKDVVFEITKERRDAYKKIKHELTNAPVPILPDFELPFKFYIDAACSQGLGAALHQRQIVYGEPREGVICYISRQLKDSEARYGETKTECLFLVWALEKLHYFKSHTNADGLSRWPLDNVRRNPAYDPEVSAKIPTHFMEKDRRKNSRFFKWEPESGTPDSEDTESEGTETPILGIRASELHNELFSAAMNTYSKHKQCCILLKLLQQKYRSPELESQL
ncbi:hypothetical protein O181_076491 [Austropuccinia psidii MF-1]|uniref:Reverse transcriptase/retrotransposon-derived protein RNase H-like domain-containing protein n=1 Tax=Austropuccinia psidii MF-1 TaxID=1389203 RepID=A0A9Q3FAI1_9BASI|nr:hypothetical protein [Austropuccinia psidii MF-1]